MRLLAAQSAIIHPGHQAPLSGGGGASRPCPAACRHVI